MSDLFPSPGDWAVVATPGVVGRLIRLVTHSEVNHGFVYVGEGRIVEANPAGVQESPLSNYDGHLVRWFHFDPATGVGLQVAAAARELLGRPYSWVDDVCLAVAAIFGRRAPRWVRNRIASTGHLICSQLIDLACLQAGVHLFDDRRMPGDVTPEDLDAVIDRRPVPINW
jgi:cell wall-associated NlpC family hydrolase